MVKFVVTRHFSVVFSPIPNSVQYVWKSEWGGFFEFFLLFFFFVCLVFVLVLVFLRFFFNTIGDHVMSTPFVDLEAMGVDISWSSIAHWFLGLCRRS